MRSWAALLLLAAPLTADAAVAAIPWPFPPPPPSPVTLVMVGPKAIRVRLSAGYVLPCDSSANVKLLDAKVQPGTTKTWMASTYCFCVEQTHHDFPDVGWSTPRQVCRARGCPGAGCGYTNDPLTITLKSDPPK